KAKTTAGDLTQTILKLGEAHKLLVPLINDTYDALKVLGLVSADVYRSAADRALEAYKKLEAAEQDRKVSLYQLTQARLIWLEAERQAAITAGEIWSEADQGMVQEAQKTLDQLEQKTAKHTQRTKTLWEEWGKAIGSTIKSFIGDVLDRLFSGSDVNAQLDQQ